MGQKRTSEDSPTPCPRTFRANLLKFHAHHKINPTDPGCAYTGAAHMFSTDPSAIAALWSRARAMFARASAIIGSAQTLAAIAALTRTRRREIACWLGLAESIVRKLIFAEASVLKREPEQRITPNAGRAAAAKDHTKPARQIDLDQPSTWPARFAFAPPRDPLAVPESRAPRIRALWGPTAPAPPQRRAPAHSTPTTMRFAFRLEALRRVFADPAPYARRLARIFHRLSRRHPEAAHRYAIASARPHGVDLGDPRLIVEVIAVALAAAAVLANTS